MTKAAVLGAAVVGLLAGNALAAIPADKVTELPGLKGKVKFPMYSGFLDVGGKYMMHYEFHGSERSSTDPVVLWQQGGPGASSIVYGALTEMGAFHTGYPSLENMTDGVPNLMENPHSWNKMANMLYFEHPPGVGYSYCYAPGDKKKLIECPTWNDTAAAEVLADTIVQFFDDFAEFQGYNFYISGESYSGIYVPSTAKVLSMRSLKFDLKGLLVGNGCINVPGATESNIGNCNGPDRDEIELNVLHYHSMISDEMYNKVYKTCKFPENGNWRNLPAGCDPAEALAYGQAGKFNPYFVNDNCPGPNYESLDSDELTRPKMSLLNRMAASQLTEEETASFEAINTGRVNYPKGGVYYPCGADQVAVKYLMNEKVREALHIAGTPIPKTFNYVAFGFSSIDNWPALIEKYRTMIYNGVADTVCPWPQNEQWVNSLNYTITSPWAEWFSPNGNSAYGKAAAGYHRSYVSPNGGFLSYVTIKDAGHMVPQYQPSVAFQMFKRFLDNDWPANN